MLDKKILLSPKSIGTMIIVVLFLITFGGYALYFHSQKKLNQKTHDYEMLEEKGKDLESNAVDMQKKVQTMAEEIKQVNKDYEIILQKNQECKEAHEELQIKYEALKAASDKQKMEAPTTSSSASTPKDDGSHPVQQLTPTTPILDPSAPPPLDTKTLH